MKSYILSQRELRTKATYTRSLANTATGLFVRIALFVAATLILSMRTNAQKHFNNVDADGVILDGYDAVAFFTDNKPVKGDAKFQFNYEDAIYHFASQEHLD